MEREKIEKILNEAGFIFTGIDGKEKIWLCKWTWEKDGKVIFFHDGRVNYKREFIRFYKIEMFNKEDAHKHYGDIKNRIKIRSLKKLKESVIPDNNKIENLEIKLWNMQIDFAKKEKRLIEMIESAKLYLIKGEMANEKLNS